MILHEAQKKVVEDKHRFRVVNAGRRFGKSVMAVEELFFNAVTKESNVAYIAPTYLQAREIAWTLLKKRVQDFSIIDINETRLEMTINNNVGSTSRIVLKGWESIESLRGQSFDFLVLDEVAMYREFNIGWEEVIRPTLTDRKGNALFISTPKGFNFWYDIYNMESKDNDYKSFHFTAYDNPFIHKEELEKIKLELTEDRYAQEILADFRKTQGLVYKEFDRDIHIYSDDSSKANYKMFQTIDNLVGCDWGYTNPCALGKIEKSSDNCFFMSQEWYKTEKTTAEIIEVAKSFGGNKYYPDPAEPDRNEEMRRAGLNVREVSKDVEAGINCVRELFKTKRFYIHESCVNTIAELETYRYGDKKPEKNEPEAPIKENDHLMDMMRYVLYMQVGKGTNSFATVHYSQSAMPQNHNDMSLPNTPKRATTHYAKL